MSNVTASAPARRQFLSACGTGLALAASGLLTACGGGGSTTTPSSAASSTPVASSTAVVSSSDTVNSRATIAAVTAAKVAGVVPLVFSTWGAGGSAYSAEHKVVDAFNLAHTNIRAQVLEIPFGSYRDKLLAELAGGDAPDNMAIDHDMFPFMVQKNVFARLDPLVSRDKTVLDDYFASALQGMSYQGALYGLPTGGSAYYLFWSPRLFQQAGLPAPNDLMAQGAWTWQAFLDAAQKLTQATGAPAQFGVDAGLNLSAIAPWVWSNGGAYLSNDQQQLQIDQAAAVDAVQFLHDLIWKEHVTPPPGTAPGPIKSFIAGKLAMHLTWGGTGIAQFAPVKNLSWDIALPPAKDGKSFVTWAPLNPMTINKQTKHPDQSWTFERWYNGTPGMQVFSQNGRVPVARSVLTSPTYLEATPPAHKQVVLQGMQVGKPAFINPNWTLASEQLTPFLTKIAKNTMPVADALKQAVALADPILAGKG